MKKFRRWALLCVAALWLLGVFPRAAFAQEDSDFKTAWVSTEAFFSHFQTEGGQSADFPELVVKAGLRLTPRWVLDFRRYAGASAGADGLRASVLDTEGRLGYRLGDNRDLYGWLSWKIWTSRVRFDHLTSNERDEGLGLGVTRYPSRRGLSYWYGLAAYPSVHESLSRQKNAMTVQGGGVYNFAGPVQFTIGYRLQTLLTDDRRGRAQEQGLILGLRGAF